MKAKYHQITYAIILVLVGGLLSSCGRKKHAAGSGAAKAPLPFDRAMFSEVTPMLDGSAYAISFDSGLWYLRGNKAMRVMVLGDAAQQAPKLSEITPILDGSAYATSAGHETGLWYLHAEHAEKVTETGSLASVVAVPTPSDKVFYALYMAEHKKRAEAEDRADNPPVDDSRDAGDPYP